MEKGDRGERGVGGGRWEGRDNQTYSFQSSPVHLSTHTTQRCMWMRRSRLMQTWATVGSTGSISGQTC